MTNYAEIVDSKVVNIIVATESSILNMNGDFVKISEVANSNHCNIGSSYNKEKNIFIRQKPYESWSLDEETSTWEPPTPKPSTGISTWDEESTSWVDITPVEIELSSPEA